MTQSQALARADGPARPARRILWNSAELLESLEPRVLLTTYAVTSTADSGPGTLRDAITAANANPGPDAITFDLPGPGPFTIKPTSGILPNITDRLSIDGTTQSGFDPSTHAPVVVLDGRGLDLSGAKADGSSVRGLEILHSSGIVLNGASHCVIAGNYLGNDGTHVGGGASAGVLVSDSASYDLIGGPTAADRNVISGNGYGVYILGHAAHIAIQGNYIGTDATGTHALSNGEAGVYDSGGYADVIGGTGGGEGNLISGNRSNGSGYGILTDPLANKPLIAGNLIGTDATGNAALVNFYAIHIQSPGTVIGGTSAGARNVIVGRADIGYAPDSVIQGNYFGTNASGTRALDSSSHLIATGDENLLVGGAAPGAGNVVSGGSNTAEGSFELKGVVNGVVQGNFIGTDAAGKAAIGNDGHGMKLANCSGVTIGGASPAARNVISGNNGPGVILYNSSNTVVQGNYIGTDATGVAPLPNRGDGIAIEGSSSQNQIGGTAAGAGNVLAFNTGAGVSVLKDPAFSPAPSLPAGNSLLSNSISSNGGLGIDLSNTTAGDGVTANDPGDADAGSNDLQNYPALTSAVSGGGFTRVAGSLNSTPGSSFLLQFFSSPAADPSGFGEGETPIGSLTVATDASGNAGFSTDLPASVPPGRLVTSTATALPTASATGDTSEFSRAVTVTQAASAVNGGAAQRSQVTSLTVRFNQAVTLAPGALTLSRLITDSTGAALGATDVSAAVAWSTPDGGATWAAVVVSGGPADGGGGSLSDGVYRLTLHPASVLNAATGTPLAGGDEVLSTFHRLYGDADGNGSVNASDYTRFKRAFGSAAYDAAFDADGNGVVNTLDYLNFRKRFGLMFSGIQAE